MIAFNLHSPATENSTSSKATRQILFPGIPANNTNFYVYIKDIITGGIRLLGSVGDVGDRFFISYDGSEIVSETGAGILTTTVQPSLADGK